MQAATDRTISLAYCISYPNNTFGFFIGQSATSPHIQQEETASCGESVRFSESNNSVAKYRLF